MTSLIKQNRSTVLHTGDLEVSVKELAHVRADRGCGKPVYHFLQQTVILLQARPHLQGKLYSAMSVKGWQSAAGS